MVVGSFAGLIARTAVALLAPGGDDAASPPSPKAIAMSVIELATIEALRRAQETVDLLALVNQTRDDTAKVRENSKGGYNIGRLLAAMATGEDPQLAAPIEWEAGERIAARVGRPARPGYCYVPLSRDMNVATASAGGYLVGAPVEQVFADALHANSVALRLGVQTVPVGPGSAPLPRVSTAASAVWLTDETSTVTESTLTFAQQSMTPKTVGVYTEFSRHWIKAAAPEAQAFILRGLAAVVAQAIDAALIAGTGADGQPQGLLNVSGIGSASGATLTWATVAEAIKVVEAAGGNPDRMGWALAADAGKVCRTREKAAGSGFVMAGGQIDGRPAHVSASVSNGVALLGDWSQAIIATWGALEIAANPYAASVAAYKAGIIGVRALLTMDVGVLQPTGFYKLTSLS